MRKGAIEMKNQIMWLLAVAVTAAAAIPPAMAHAGQGESAAKDVAIVGDDLIRATEVALAHVGGGSVTGTEVDDEESYYEVEVTREDGAQIDVQLDEKFEVVGTELDGSSLDD
jgi:uncharacterized membrane protein YkoI